MRVLTVCEGGNVRSVALAYVLKSKYGQDAISSSWRYNSSPTLGMLFEWAERIVVAQEVFVEKIPEQYRPKVLVLDMGPDRWGILTDLVKTAEFLVDQAMKPIDPMPKKSKRKG